MRNRTVIVHAPQFTIAASLLLAACVNQPTAAPPLPSLAQNREEPALALIENVLAGYFAREGAASDPPTTCVELRPEPLSATQEQALIARFPRLAPRGRCDTQRPLPFDEFTGERAVLVQVHGLECRDATHCTAWVASPGSSAVRYTLSFENNVWSVGGDRRILAE